jgi:chromosome segregation ATPase
MEVLMADTTNHRLDRIEEKIDQLATAMVSIARAEEKIAAMQEFQQNQIERVNRLSVKLDDIEKKVDENHRTVCLINKLVYAALIAAVGAYVAQYFT